MVHSRIRKRQRSIIRLFVSSTFTDFKVERDVPCYGSAARLRAKRSTSALAGLVVLA